ncbi:MAG: hypothetical protein ABR909_12310 [Candidatus Bathyarchaeia archaeon]|jgi:hypothetical protein
MIFLLAAQACKLAQDLLESLKRRLESIHPQKPDAIMPRYHSDFTVSLTVYTNVYEKRIYFDLR